MNRYHIVGKEIIIGKSGVPTIKSQVNFSATTYFSGLSSSGRGYGWQFMVIVDMVRFNFSVSQSVNEMQMQTESVETTTD